MTLRLEQHPDDHASAVRWFDRRSAELLWLARRVDELEREEVDAHAQGLQAAGRAARARDRAVVTEEIARAERAIAELERILGPRLTGHWADDVWAAGLRAESPGARPGDLMRVGHLHESAAPVFIDHPARAHLHIRVAAGLEEQVSPLLDSILLRALLTTSDPVVHTVDTHGNGRLVAAFSPGNNAVVPRTSVTDQATANQLDDLSMVVADITAAKLRGAYADVDDYNESALAKGLLPESHRFVVVISPAALDRRATVQLARLVRTGHEAGVHVITISFDGSHYDPAAAGTRVDLLPDGAVVHAEGTRLRFQVDPGPDVALIHRSVETVADAYRERLVARMIDLTLLHDEADRWRERPSTSVSTPIGMAGEERVDIGLHIERGDVHALVVGQTGAGKSSLLHALILGLAETYSPDDLQFLLVDAKAGVELGSYADDVRSGRPGLPHARVVAVESDVEMYLSVLDHLGAEMRRRALLLKDHGVANLVELDPVRRLPRLVAVLDEFHVLLNDDRYRAEAARHLTDIAKQGRSVGIHLVLATQSTAGLGSRGENKALFDNVGLRIAFRTDAMTSEQMLDGDAGASRIAGAGQAYVKRSLGVDVGEPRLVQVAFEPRPRRETRIAELAATAVERGVIGVPRNERHVFGDAAGEPLSRCLELVRSLRSPVTDRQMWVGSPTTIDPLFAPVLRRRSGGNVLLIGGSATLVARTVLPMLLGASSTTRPVRIDIASPRDLEATRAMSESLAEFATAAGIPFRDWGDDPTELLAEVETTVVAGPVSDRLVVVLDTHDRAEGGSLEHILKAGPDVGVHTFLWVRNLSQLVSQVLGRSIGGPAKVLGLFATQIEVDVNHADRSALGLPRHTVPNSGRTVVWSNDDANTTRTVVPFCTPRPGEIRELVTGYSAIGPGDDAHD